MLEDLFGGHSAFGVYLEDGVEQVSDAVVAQIVRDRLVLTVLDFAEKVAFELTEKRQFPDEDYVQNYATRPYISSEGRVGDFPNDVRVHVVRRATVHVELLILSSAK